ncbi:MAG: hypothetical protein EOO75_08680, partial [Myxococcales bacterium]
MYVLAEKKPSWLRMILDVRGSTLPRIWLRIGVVTALAAALTVLHEVYHQINVSLTPVPFTLIGLPLGIFLGFRNSASYDRFWEGRRLWGSIVNTSRTLSRLTLSLVGPSDGARVDPETLRAWQVEVIHGVIAYAHALRLHLRADRRLDELTTLLPAPVIEGFKGQRNVPAALLLHLGQTVGQAWRRGWIHPQHVPLFEQGLATLTDCQGGCERIRTTPVPFSYIVLIHRVTGIYCLLLPLGLIDTLHYFTPLAVLLVSYALFGLDAIGDEIEDPFGTDTNDLPLSSISRTIEINLRQALGEATIPA